MNINLSIIFMRPHYNYSFIFILYYDQLFNYCLSGFASYFSNNGNNSAEVRPLRCQTLDKFG